MNTFVLVLLALLALAARALYVKLALTRWERLWRFTSGPVTVELRRHAEMAKLDNDSLDYPQPREFRTLSMRIGGIPVWSQQAIVSLPGEVDARIGEVAANEFDHLFTAQFRLAWSKQTVQPLYSARH
jgi:hypothetical protein